MMPCMFWSASLDSVHISPPTTLQWPLPLQPHQPYQHYGVYIAPLLPEDATYTLSSL